MYEENIKEPIAIMELYKKYEYLLNVSKNDLVDSLLSNKEQLEATGGKSGKVSLELIREQIQKYHDAAEEILNLSNDFIDTPMFRVQCQKMKKKLSETALSIRDKLIK